MLSLKDKNYCINILLCHFKKKEAKDYPKPRFFKRKLIIFSYGREKSYICN